MGGLLFFFVSTPNSTCHQCLKQIRLAHVVPATFSAAIFLIDWKRTDQPEDINPLATSVRAAGLQSKSTMHNSKCRQQCQATIKKALG